MSSGWRKDIWNLSHPDDLAIGSISSRPLMPNALCHLYDIRSFSKSSRWHNVNWTLCHPDVRNNLITKSSGWLSLSHPYDLAIGRISFGWFMANVFSHPDDIRSFHKSSGWNDVGWILCHPDEIAPGRISSRRRMTNEGCHPDDLFY